MREMLPESGCVTNTSAAPTSDLPVPARAPQRERGLVVRHRLVIREVGPAGCRRTSDATQCRAGQSGATDDSEPPRPARDRESQSRITRNLPWVSVTRHHVVRQKRDAPWMRDPSRDDDDADRGILRPCGTPRDDRGSRNRQLGCHGNAVVERYTLLCERPARYRHSAGWRQAFAREIFECSSEPPPYVATA